MREKQYRMVRQFILSHCKSIGYTVAMKPIIHNRGIKKSLSGRAAAERAEDMAKDTRHLAFVGNSWHFD